MSRNTSKNVKNQWVDNDSKKYIHWSPLQDDAKGIQAAPQSDEIIFKRNFSFIDISQLVNEGRIIELEYHHLINP